MKEMKIVKRSKFNDEAWYSLYIDESYIAGSYDKEKIEQFFEQIRDNPNIFVETTEVIKTDFIDIK